MSWFRRRTPKRPPVDQRAADIRIARRELRAIEWDLSRLDPRADVTVVRALADRHYRWRTYLANLGVNHPAPQIAW